MILAMLTFELTLPACVMGNVQRMQRRLSILILWIEYVLLSNLIFISGLLFCLEGHSHG